MRDSSVKALHWAIVDFKLNLLEISPRDVFEIGFLGKVVPKNANSIFIGPSLVGGIGVTKVDFYANFCFQCLAVVEFFASVVCY